MNDKFIVSVANALLINEKTDTLVCKAKALIDSALRQELSKMEIKGGWGNKTLFVYNYDKKITIELNSASFEPAFFAVNSGVDIQNKLKGVYKFEERVELDSSGKGTLSTLPIGKVFVMADNKTSMTVEPISKEITVPAFKGKTVKVTYQYEKTVDTIELDAEKSTGVYKLVLELQVFDKKTGVPSLCQIQINEFKPSGNFEMNLSASSPSTSRLSGDAMANDDGIYGSIDLFPGEESEVDFSILAIAPAEIDLEVNDTIALNVYGIRGGAFAPVLMDKSLLNFKSDDNLTASVTGNIVKGIKSGETNIVVSLKDNPDVSGIATVSVTDGI